MEDGRMVVTVGRSCWDGGDEELAMPVGRSNAEEHRLGSFKRRRRDAQVRRVASLATDCRRHREFAHCTPVAVDLYHVQRVGSHHGIDHHGINHHGINHRGINHHGINHYGINHHGINHYGINHHASAESPRIAAAMFVPGVNKGSDEHLHEYDRRCRVIGSNAVETCPGVPGQVHRETSVSRALVANQRRCRLPPDPTPPSTEGGPWAGMPTGLYANEDSEELSSSSEALKLCQRLAERPQREQDDVTRPCSCRWQSLLQPKDPKIVRAKLAKRTNDQRLSPGRSHEP
ncbi:flap endonuclease 1 [Venturia nashicola]|nr:flap endonuclease 1 [Venturia nashicola]